MTEPKLYRYRCEGDHNPVSSHPLTQCPAPACAGLPLRQIGGPGSRTKREKAGAR